jgi:hypothetical protein
VKGPFEGDRKMRYIRLFSSIALAAMIMVILTGCGTQTVTNAPTSPPGIGDFYINILDLNQQSPGIEVRVEALTLDQNRSIENYSENLIYYMDVDPPTTAGESVKTAVGTFLEPSLDNVYEYSVVWNDVPAGTHTFSAQLVNPDYTPLSPAIVVQTTITVPSEIMQQEPAIQIMSLETDYDFAMNSVSVYDFRLNDDEIGRANSPGEGHLIYYLDAEPPTVQGQSAVTASGTYKISTSPVTWKHIQPGIHTFSVQLVNNDNTPLSPAVVSKTTVELIPLSP